MHRSRTFNSYINKKAVLSQRWLCNAPYIWVPWKFLSLPDYTYGYFPKFFRCAFVLINFMNVHRKFEMHSLSHSWDNSDWSFGWGLWSRGTGGRRGSQTVPFKRALLTSYRPSIVTFPLSLRFRDIAAFVLQHATFPPTSSLPKISPCSPGSRWMTFGLWRAKMLG